MFTTVTSRCYVLLVAALFSVGTNVVGTACAQAIAEAVAKDVTSSSSVTPRQKIWLNASLSERLLLSEEIGEEGARAFAKEKGWTAVFDGLEKGVPQGPDQVYMAADGTLHVLEAKGGSGQVSHAYGYPQGSSEWAVEASRNLLKRSAATDQQKVAARQILQKAAEGRLEVHVVQTAHMLGEPKAPDVKQTIVCSDAARRLAITEIDEAAVAGKAASVVAVTSVRPAISNGAAKSSTIVKTVPVRAMTPTTTAGVSGVVDDVAAPVLGTVTKAAGPLAIGIDAVVRLGDIGEAGRLHSEGVITSHQFDKVVARNAGGFAGSTAGAAGGAYGGAAIGTMICPGVGTAVGAVVGTLFGSISGGAVGEAVGEAMTE